MSVFAVETSLRDVCYSKLSLTLTCLLPSPAAITEGIRDILEKAQALWADQSQFVLCAPSWWTIQRRRQQPIRLSRVLIVNTPPTFPGHGKIDSYAQRHKFTSQSSDMTFKSYQICLHGWRPRRLFPAFCSTALKQARHGTTEDVDRLSPKRSDHGVFEKCDEFEQGALLPCGGSVQPRRVLQFSRLDSKSC